MSLREILWPTRKKVLWSLAAIVLFGIVGGFFSIAAAHGPDEFALLAQVLLWPVLLVGWLTTKLPNLADYAIWRIAGSVLGYGLVFLYYYLLTCLVFGIFRLRRINGRGKKEKNG
jgi:hypothetical protein